MFLGDWVVWTGLLPLVIPRLCPWLGSQAMDKAMELPWVIKSCLEYVVTFWYVTSNMFLGDWVVQTGLPTHSNSRALSMAWTPSHGQSPGVAMGRQPCLDYVVTFWYVTPLTCFWVWAQAMDKAKEALLVGSPVWTMWSLFDMIPL